jgi:signal transduction histidine kinase
VLDNLVGNALKYSPSTGKVTVTVDVIDGRGTVTVADQGPGISEVDRQNVFGAFFRTPDATRSQAPGLGLGLYICLELVRAHDGAIDVGESPGGGAEFRVTLPITSSAEGGMTPVQLEIEPALLNAVSETEVTTGS